MPPKYVDPLNIALIILTCALAHMAPYHLLLLSYAILGPAHYLTQISWLHDRRYFVNFSLLAPAMWVLSSLLVFMSFIGGHHQGFSAAILFTALFIAVVSILPPGNTALRAAAVVGCALFFMIAACFPPIVLFIAILLPTVMHIFVFTATFMWAGAMKSGKKSGYIAVLTLLVCAGTFFISGTDYGIVPHFMGISFFAPTVEYLQKIGFSRATNTQLFGFLSFAYTYHYLNWFSKSEVIHWNRIPAWRMIALVILCAITLSLYAFNYIVGFLSILIVSYAHVLLEFPLNLRTFALIVRGKT